ncbi:MAG: cadherin-like domain-containing protein [Candidatus Accumulibacter sp.]|nr:cadherin-like domain-containing protein [Candidatus Accumulibacter propinquus]
MAATPGRSPTAPATAASPSTPTAASPTPRAPTTTAPTASPTPDRCRWRCLHRHRPPDRQPHRRPAGRRRRHLPHRRRQRADRTDPGPQRHPSGDGGNTWALATGPSHGSVVVNADGSFTYTPDADYHGPDSFTYILTDADGDVSTATALLTVNPIDDLPVAVDDTFLTDEDSALTGQTLAPNDTPRGMAATPGHSPPDSATAASWSTPTAASPTPRTPTTTAPTASPTS